MITAMTAIDFLSLHNYNYQQISFIVRKSCTSVGGTSAKLSIDEVYTIE